MAGVSRVGQDKASTPITGALQSTVKVNGKLVAVKGATIAPHGAGPHAAPVTKGCSSTVKAGGIPVVRAGDAASCGHPCTGASNVNAG